MTKALAEVCAITMGQAPPGESYNRHGEGLPLIAGAGDFRGGRIAPTKFTSQPSKICAPGDIVLSIRASIGAKVWADGRYCLGRGVAAFRPGPNLVSSYLWHWLSQSEHLLAAKGRGATFPQVSRDDIAEMPITLPPLEEQCRIAAILDHADALRAKRRQVLANLDGLTQSIFHDKFGDPIDNPSGLPIKVLRDWVDPGRPITYGILKPGPNIPDGVPYVRVADMQNRGIEVTGVRRTTQAISAEYRRSTLRSGDLLMSIRGHVGRFAFVPEILSGANITQDSARLAVRDPDAALYLRAAMESPSTQHWMTRRTKGAAVRGINLGDLRELPVPMPPAGEIERFARTVRVVESQRERSHLSTATADELFASLQARAFRGEL